MTTRLTHYSEKVMRIYQDLKSHENEVCLIIESKLRYILS